MSFPILGHLKIDNGLLSGIFFTMDYLKLLLCVTKTKLYIYWSF